MKHYIRVVERENEDGTMTYRIQRKFGWLPWYSIRSKFSECIMEWGVKETAEAYRDRLIHKYRTRHTKSEKRKWRVVG